MSEQRINSKRIAVLCKQLSLPSIQKGKDVFPVSKEQQAEQAAPLVYAAVQHNLKWQDSFGRVLFHTVSGKSWPCSKLKLQIPRIHGCLPFNPTFLHSDTSSAQARFLSWYRSSPWYLQQGGKNGCFWMMSIPCRNPFKTGGFRAESQATGAFGQHWSYQLHTWLCTKASHGPKDSPTLFQNRTAGQCNSLQRKTCHSKSRWSFTDATSLSPAAAKAGVQASKNSDIEIGTVHAYTPSKRCHRFKQFVAQGLLNFSVFYKLSWVFFQWFCPISLWK